MHGMGRRLWDKTCRLSAALGCAIYLEWEHGLVLVVHFWRLAIRPSKEFGQLSKGSPANLGALMDRGTRRGDSHITHLSTDSLGDAVAVEHVRHHQPQFYNAL